VDDTPSGVNEDETNVNLVDYSGSGLSSDQGEHIVVCTFVSFAHFRTRDFVFIFISRD
jgi:hypothetical protein